ncbi:phosphopantetheine-binding protein [Leptolyngbya sp. FACHB-36]|uniref:phosphopantetheine-binding protein n=1 Tax=Leptolyngbya sp. FACHB-36 TaxID=2692808 RepID=UPI0018EFA087|nr:phosphopantetheine-binding protein [Leptolyngbya sp. FACHB-36]
MVMDTLTEILLELGIDRPDIVEGAFLRKDLQLDSTETVQIALELKRRLGVNVKLEARQDTTIGQVCDKVVQAMSLNPAAT